MAPAVSDAFGCTIAIGGFLPSIRPNEIDRDQHQYRKIRPVSAISATGEIFHNLLIYKESFGNERPHNP
jgi:hypothetical protein